MPAYGKIIVKKRNGNDGSHCIMSTSSCSIGRSLDSDIRIQLPNVSKQHCQLVATENNGQVSVVNLTKTGITLINGVSVKRRRSLKHLDVVTVSDRSFRWEYTPESIYNARKPKSTPAIDVKDNARRSFRESEESVVDVKGKTDFHKKDNVPKENVPKVVGMKKRLRKTKNLTQDFYSKTLKKAKTLGRLVSSGSQKLGLASNDDVNAKRVLKIHRRKRVLTNRKKRSPTSSQMKVQDTTGALTKPLASSPGSWNNSLVRSELGDSFDISMYKTPNIPRDMFVSPLNSARGSTPTKAGKLVLQSAKKSVRRLSLSRSTSKSPKQDKQLARRSRSWSSNRAGIRINNEEISAILAESSSTNWKRSPGYPGYLDLSGISRLFEESEIGEENSPENTKIGQRRLSKVKIPVSPLKRRSSKRSLSLSPSVKRLTGQKMGSQTIQLGVLSPRIQVLSETPLVTKRRSKSTPAKEMKPEEISAFLSTTSSGSRTRLKKGKSSAGSLNLSGLSCLFEEPSPKTMSVPASGGKSTSGRISPDKKISFSPVIITQMSPSKRNSESFSVRRRASFVKTPLNEPGSVRRSLRNQSSARIHSVDISMKGDSLSRRMRSVGKSLSAKHSPLARRGRSVGKPKSPSVERLQSPVTSPTSSGSLFGSLSGKDSPSPGKTTPITKLSLSLRRSRSMGKSLSPVQRPLSPKGSSLLAKGPSPLTTLLRRSRSMGKSLSPIPTTSGKNSPAMSLKSRSFSPRRSRSMGKSRSSIPSPSTNLSPLEKTATIKLLSPSKKSFSPRRSRSMGKSPSASLSIEQPKESGKASPVNPFSPKRSSMGQTVSQMPSTSTNLLSGKTSPMKPRKSLSIGKSPSASPKIEEPLTAGQTSPVTTLSPRKSSFSPGRGKPMGKSVSQVPSPSMNLSLSMGKSPSASPSTSDKTSPVGPLPPRKSSFSPRRSRSMGKSLSQVPSPSINLSLSGKASPMKRSLSTRKSLSMGNSPSASPLTPVKPLPPWKSSFSPRRSRSMGKSLSASPSTPEKTLPGKSLSPRKRSLLSSGSSISPRKRRSMELSLSPKTSPKISLPIRRSLSPIPSSLPAAPLPRSESFENYSSPRSSPNEPLPPKRGRSSTPASLARSLSTSPVKNSQSPKKSLEAIRTPSDVSVSTSKSSPWMSTLPAKRKSLSPSVLLGRSSPQFNDSPIAKRGRSSARSMSPARSPASSKKWVMLSLSPEKSSVGQDQSPQLFYLSPSISPSPKTDPTPQTATDVGKSPTRSETTSSCDLRSLRKRPMTRRGQTPSRTPVSPKKKRTLRKKAQASEDDSTSITKSISPLVTQSSPTPVKKTRGGRQVKKKGLSDIAGKRITKKVTVQKTQAPEDDSTSVAMSISPRTSPLVTQSSPTPVKKTRGGRQVKKVLNDIAGKKVTAQKTQAPEDDSTSVAMSISPSSPSPIKKLRSGRQVTAKRKSLSVIAAKQITKRVTAQKTPSRKGRQLVKSPVKDTPEVLPAAPSSVRSLRRQKVMEVDEVVELKGTRSARSRKVSPEMKETKMELGDVPAKTKRSRGQTPVKAAETSSEKTSVTRRRQKASPINKKQKVEQMETIEENEVFAPAKRGGKRKKVEGTTPTSTSTKSKRVTRSKCAESSETEVKSTRAKGKSKGKGVAR